MIFLTVGHEMPFDRLVHAVDEWCRDRNRSDVFGQIGDPGPKGYIPSHFEYKFFIEPDEYERRFRQADLIIAHAGTGSIITALTLPKPILIMPRHRALKETRNDHQIATADRFASRPGVKVAIDEMELGPALDRIVDNLIPVGEEIASPFAESRLLETIREFIHQNGAVVKDKSINTPWSGARKSDSRNLCNLTEGGGPSGKWGSSI